MEAFVTLLKFMGITALVAILGGVVALLVTIIWDFWEWYKGDGGDNEQL